MNHFNVEMVCFACLTTHSAAMMLHNNFLFYAPADDITAIFSFLPLLSYILNVN